MKSDTLERQSLDEYREALDNLAKRGDTMVFSTEGAHRAGAVLETIFKHAKKSIKIYTRSMNDVITDQDNVYKALRGFLENFGTLHIIVDRNPFEDIDYAKSILMLKKFYSNDSNVEFRIADEPFRQSVQQVTSKNEVYYFLVADGMQVATERDDDKHLLPFISFNNKKYADAYARAFDKHFLVCEKIAIPHY